MVFGDRLDFAIEADVEPNLAPPSAVWGRHRGDVEAPDARTAEEHRRDSTFWSAHDFLTGWGEQFNGCKAFILCPPDGAVRILSRELPGPMGRGVEVSRAGLVAAIEGFTRWFEQQARRLGGGRA
ncbi:uncharacterized protein SOCEGT47_033670 [Sorangium cellulosum]|uniref:Uncharacterized protein n=1 Tax=Sorangium cellulosum TaxID=56 RepID=A0A4P2Q1A4_SORCE|nr:hypothetical protein [Sorangium cellulosum]AUX22851.1 uncharacterized protein SOCEGT47_033670 [Sorangium cellulosum]